MRILTYPHPLLLTRLEPLEEIDSQVRQDAADMLTLCAAHNGQGLSANQVGLTYQMFVVPSLKSPVVINPRIVKGKNRKQSLEACLSLPNYTNVAMRYMDLRVEYYNLDGELVKAHLHDLDAVVFQHEFEHLRGILISHKKVVKA